MTNAASNLLEGLGSYFRLIFESFAVCFRSPPSWHLIRDQMYLVGVASLPVVAITGFSTGMVLAAQSMFQLSDFGVQGATGLMVSKAMLVELGPVLTAFMVTGRVGAAMCAELGTMRVTEQVDALKSMAVNPTRYLVAPRFAAGTIMMPILSIFSAFMGVVGGYMVAVYMYNLASADYLDPLSSHIKTFDIMTTLVKSFVFGIVIVTICCYKGMNTSGGAAGVGRATTNSVVLCYIVILILNFLLTVILNDSHDFFVQHLGGWM